MSEQIYLKKFKLLAGMALLLQSCTKENELFDVTYLYLPQLFPELYGEIFLQPRVGKKVEAVFCWGMPEKACPEPDFSLCKAFTTGVVVDSRTAECPPCNDFQSRDCCIPLCDGGHAFGLFCLGGIPASLRVQYRGLAFVTAEYLALAICNIRLKGRLHELTIKDPLTGLFNRRHMDEVIPREIARAKRAGASCGAIMIDLDYFKRVNDTFGHDGGDAVLKTVGKFLNTELRQEDVVCRFGGEEFFVFMVSGCLADYCRRAQELREGIKALDISWQGQQIPVTASLGLALFPDHANSYEALLKEADQALYAAKDQGRDRVVVRGGKNLIVE